MRGYVQPDILADGILVGGTFIVVLLFVGGITMKISDKVLDSRIGLVDRIGGFVFGLARGLVLVVIAFTFFSWLVPEETQPNWIKNARSVNLLKDAGDTIISFLPDDPAFSLPGIDDDGADEEYKQ
jgi:membrane protein required for colicin V production